MTSLFNCQPKLRQSTREAKKRVQEGGSGWRRVSGLIFDKRIIARVKGKIYKMVVKAAVMFGLEIVALTKSHRAEA